MKITKYIILQLKAKKEGSMYSIFNKQKAADLIEMLDYVFFEYTRTDYDLITQNLSVLDTEMDDEVIMHGNRRSLYLDLKNPDTIYISSFADYLDFEENLPFTTSNRSFVDELKKNNFDHLKVERKSFLLVLQDWHTIIEEKPAYVILHQNKNDQ